MTPAWPPPAAASRAFYDQHLLTEPARGRYRLHDLLREHARALAAADDPADCDAAAGRLLDYYLHTALAAGRHIALAHWPPAASPPGRPPACAPPLSTPRQATAWLEAERANLHAAAGYAAACGRPRMPSRSPPRWRLPARPGPLGPGRRPAPDRPGRGAPGRGPARPGRRPHQLGVVQADRGLPGRRRQPDPGAGAVPRPRRPAGQATP